ncbi:hypothetical protein BV22DRAFT_1036729 [Leucogyrophana mollusca]|uniref:Uncharacterized protein n=1 Tax=Leucogyrophana mollusca TaxID=85980 RepID=A0ACB8BEI1_9AGAM|nr:hypothetical protein BV22DRAFT_1036729 [Leucogyrophana mollusca]
MRIPGAALTPRCAPHMSWHTCLVTALAEIENFPSTTLIVSIGCDVGGGESWDSTCVGIRPKVTYQLSLSTPCESLAPLGWRHDRSGHATFLSDDAKSTFSLPTALPQLPPIKTVSLVVS